MTIIKFLSTGKGILVYLSFMILIMFLLWLLIKKSNKKQYTGNILLIAFFILIGIFFYILTFSFPNTQGVGPRIIPRLLVLILVPLNIYILIGIINNIETPDPQNVKSDLSIIFIVLIVLYMFSMKYIDYYISSFFLYLTMYILGNRKYIIYII